MSGGSLYFPPPAFLVGLRLFFNGLAARTRGVEGGGPPSLPLASRCLSEQGGWPASGVACRCTPPEALGVGPPSAAAGARGARRPLNKNLGLHKKRYCAPECPARRSSVARRTAVSKRLRCNEYLSNVPGN